MIVERESVMQARTLLIIAILVLKMMWIINLATMYSSVMPRKHVIVRVLMVVSNLNDFFQFLSQIPKKSGVSSYDKWAKYSLKDII